MKLVNGFKSFMHQHHFAMTLANLTANSFTSFPFGHLDSRVTKQHSQVAAKQFQLLLAM
jgi:hypothetical protein